MQTKSLLGKRLSYFQMHKKINFLGLPPPSMWKMLFISNYQFCIYIRTYVHTYISVHACKQTKLRENHICNKCIKTKELTGKTEIQNFYISRTKIFTNVFLFNILLNAQIVGKLLLFFTCKWNIFNKHVEGGKYLWSR